MRLKTPKDWVTAFEIKERSLVIKFPSPRRYISSAVYGGGIGRALGIINHQVSEGYYFSKGDALGLQSEEDPSQTLDKIANRHGIGGRCAGLMTAVDLSQLVLTREQAVGLWVEGFFTVGVSNAVRVGEPTVNPSSIGTINMILVTNANLSMAALVGAVAVATESKTAIVLDRRIRSCSGHGWATGTGTDSIVFVIGNTQRLRYSGTHTKIGELIGRVVARGIEKGLNNVSMGVPPSRKKIRPIALGLKTRKRTM